MTSTKEKIAVLERKLERNQLAWEVDYHAMVSAWERSHLLPWVLIGTSLGIGLIAGRSRGWRHVWRGALSLPVHYQTISNKMAQLLQIKK